MTSRAEHQKIKLQKEIDKFNNTHKVGDKVKILMDDDTIKEAIVTNPATILGGHTAVGWFSGIRGAYLLERVQKEQKIKPDPV